MYHDQPSGLRADNSRPRTGKQYDLVFRKFDEDRTHEEANIYVSLVDDDNQDLVEWPVMIDFDVEAEEPSGEVKQLHHDVVVEEYPQGYSVPTWKLTITNWVTGRNARINATWCFANQLKDHDLLSLKDLEARGQPVLSEKLGPQPVQVERLNAGNRNHYSLLFSAPAGQFDDDKLWGQLSSLRFALTTTTHSGTQVLPIDIHVERLREERALKLEFDLPAAYPESSTELLITSTDLMKRDGYSLQKPVIAKPGE